MDAALQITDIQLDARVTALEENNGVSPQNGKMHKCTISFCM